MSESHDSFYTVAKGHFKAEIKVRGSRFIGQVLHVASTEQALEKYLEIKKSYYDATHNCYAFRIDQNQYRFSDDGEPSGTAGRPMLQVLEGKNLRQVLGVVTRYFGGTKLGTGGLIRAYADALNLCLDQTKLIEVVPGKEYKITTQYEQQRQVEEIINNHNGIITSSDYSDKVTICCRIPMIHCNSFQEQMIHSIEITEL